MPAKKNTTMRVGIIGGGAAGFFAAAFLKDDIEIDIFEQGSRPLQKVRISGGGRCNVTQACFDIKKLLQAYPRGASYLKKPLQRFSPRQTMEFFGRCTPLKTEVDGRVFPTSNSSEDIVHCLLQSLERPNCQILYRQQVENITVSTSTDSSTLFSVQCKNPPLQDTRSQQAGEFRSYDAILLATGSGRKGYEFAERLGHKIIKPVPSLFTFRIRDPLLEGLPGLTFACVSLKMNIDGIIFKQEGPCLITHEGLSGPAVLRMSAFAARALAEKNYQAIVQINWTGEKEYYARLRQFRSENPAKTLTSQPFTLPSRFWKQVLAAANISSSLKWGNTSDESLKKIVKQVAEKDLNIHGRGVFKEEFVTAGGVACEEVDFMTMQSRIIPGLFFAGEVLDIDAITGGYNFQAAWTTAYHAAQGINQLNIE